MTASTRDVVLSVEGLKTWFHSRDGIAKSVDGVTFDLARGETLAIVGESGSGKSVTSLSIMGLLPKPAGRIEAGKILFRDRQGVQHDLAQAAPATLRKIRGAEIAMIFQEPMTSLNPLYTVGDQIAEAVLQHEGGSHDAAMRRAREMLERVEIPAAERRINEYPHQMSGGMRQRVMIALALACNPAVLIADEPTTALDVTVQRQILDLLARLQERKKMSILFISHDLALVGEVARNIIVMRGGEVREAGAIADVFSAPRDAYTRALLACRPRLDARPRRLPVIDDIVNGRAPATGERSAVPVSGAPLIEVAGLSKAYRLKEGFFRRKQIDAVKRADFVLHKGRTLGVVGESGSGKTTIGMMLTRLTPASAGRIMFEGRDLAALAARELQPYRRRIQIIFQNPYASLNPRFTVGQILMEPMRLHGIGANDDERARLALGWLDKVGLPAAAFGKYPHEFSGGQRQRIAIARCLTMRPEVIVCDESVSALDVSVQATVLNLLLDLQEEFGLTYLFISHDLAVVKYMADDILVMSNGEIVERGSSEEIYRSPRHPYTRQLLAAIPRGDVHGTAAAARPA